MPAREVYRWFLLVGLSWLGMTCGWVMVGVMSVVPSLIA